jgi:uncharacterized membrane protein HdeD (DUF308 family)
MNTKNTKTQDVENPHIWSIALGMLLIILGILAIVILPNIMAVIAIASSSLAMQSMTVVLAWTFLIAAILRVNLAIETRRARGFGLNILLSIIQFAVSSLLVNGIIGSIFSLTLALGIAVFIEGVFEVFLAFRLRPKSSWNWLILKGIVTIIIGISIWSEKPFSIIGILALLPGISLISTGIWTIMFSKTICDSQNDFAIAHYPDTPSISLVKQNKRFFTPNLHKSF